MSTSIDELWARIKPNEKGLIPCVSQDIESQAVLMLAWVNREALEKTLEIGWATFWSRSRNALWTKGATSGDRQKIVEIRVDCDGDTLLYKVRAEGPACHLKTDTCFSYRLEDDQWFWDPENLKINAPK